MKTDHNMAARILVVADGGGSSIRQQLKFDVRQSPYAQAALVCRVDTDKSNQCTAYEHFIESGPLALLPVDESGYSVVWTLGQGRLKHLLEDPEEKFLEALQSEFGDRAGRFVAVTGARKSYPLALSKLKKFVRPRVVIVGNASHTVPAFLGFQKYGSGYSANPAPTATNASCTYDGTTWKTVETSCRRMRVTVGELWRAVQISTLS